MKPPVASTTPALGQATARMTDKCVIVNADDFGFSAGINRGILHAHEHGLVTSASVMVRWPSAADAAIVSRRHPNLSLGLHVDFGERVFRDGRWVLLYSVLPDAQLASAAHVAAEVARQLDAFRRLTDRDPTHLDSHQHVHRFEPLRSVLADAADKLGIPLRHHDPRVRYCGDFYGQSRAGQPYPEGVSADALARILSTLPDGITELGCHPGIGTDHPSPYGAEREREVTALCDPSVRAAASAAGIRFARFSELRTPPTPRDG